MYDPPVCGHAELGQDRRICFLAACWLEVVCSFFVVPNVPVLSSAFKLTEVACQNRAHTLCHFAKLIKGRCRLSSNLEPEIVSKLKLFFPRIDFSNSVTKLPLAGINLSNQLLDSLSLELIVIISY